MYHGAFCNSNRAVRLQHCQLRIYCSPHTRVYQLLALRLSDPAEWSVRIAVFSIPLDNRGISIIKNTHLKSGVSNKRRKFVYFYSTCPRVRDI